MQRLSEQNTTDRVAETTDIYSLTILEALYPRLSVTDLVFSEASLLCLQMATFSPSPQRDYSLQLFCVLISFCEDTSHFESGPAHITSFHFKYIFKGLVSKYSHTLSYWRLGLQRVNFGTTRPTTGTNNENVLKITAIDFSR